MADEPTTIQSEETPPERPAWLPEQFKTPEDLAKSYDEARREMDRLRSQADQQQKEFTAALERIESAQQRPEPQFNAQTDPILLAAQRAYDEGDVPTLLAIQAQISQAATAQIIDQRLGEVTEKLTGANAHDRELALRMAEDQVKPLYGERWDTEIAPKLNERLSLLPAQPSVEGYANFLREQAQIIDYPRLQAELTAAEAERQAKLTAQTLEGGSARVTLRADPNEKAWAEIRDADSGGWNKIVNG